MSTKTKARPIHREQLGARHLLLAGIGAVSLIRKNAGKTLAEAAAIAGRLPEAGSILIEGIGERSVAYRNELVRLVDQLGGQASVATTNLVSDVGSRIQPLLQKIDGTSMLFGIRIAKAQRGATAKRTRKPAKAAAKRKVRKAA